MMKRKKVTRNKSSNFDSSILILLAMLHRMVFALFSRSSEQKNSVVLVHVRLAKIFSGSEIFSCFHWSSLTILIVARQRDGALVPVPLMPSIGHIFRPFMGSLRIIVLLMVYLVFLSAPVDLVREDALSRGILLLLLLLLRLPKHS